jgi:hypothetical protein
MPEIEAIEAIPERLERHVAIKDGKERRAHIRE